MEGKKQNKTHLITVIVLIVTATIVALSIAFLLNNKNEVLEENKKVQVGNGNTSSKVDYNDVDFSYKFLKMENKKENMIYSPLSIKYALYMLNEGADGNTKTQIENVIKNTNLVKTKNLKNILSLANAIYIKEDYSKFVKEDYKKILVDKYNAEIKYDKFKDAENINGWIENKTFGQIKNMLSDEAVINAKNRLFLINALAIDMKWKDDFDSISTHARPFYLENGKKIDATTMNKETKSNSVSYYKDNNVTVLAMDLLKYGKEQFEFIAIMPDDKLSSYVDEFSDKDFKKITDNLKLASETKKGLDIYIPRFSFDYNLNLVEDLKKLGITDAFDPELADFSNMSTDNSLFVGDALHKANIDFTEKGVKAAAVTIMQMMATTALNTDQTKPIEIKINKPFMYVIRDKKTDEIWFVGTVYEPNLWEDDKLDYKDN